MANPDRILIVDDDPEIRTLLCLSLARLGYEVTSAHDGFQALELIEAERFNVVILDLMLPGPDGIEVLKYIREQRAETEVIMLTAYASLETAVEALRLGAYDYITKPFHPDTLRATVRRAAEKQRLTTRLTAIYDLNREMTLSLDVDQVAQAVLDIVERVLEFETCGLGLVEVEAEVEVELDKEQGELYWLAVRRAEREAVPRMSLSDEKGIAVAVARSGKPLYVPDVRKDSRYVEVRAATRSELAVPLKVKGRVIGVLNVESAKVDAFSQDDVWLLSTLAAQAAAAIENARLYEQAQQEIAERKRTEEEISRRNRDLRPSRPSLLPSVARSIWTK